MSLDEKSITPPRLLAVYGSLRIGQSAESFMTNPSFKHIGQDHIVGTLIPVSWFPGLFLFGDTNVVVDVFEFTDESALEPLHRFEGYNPDDLDNSLFLLKTTKLVSNGKEVFCYEYNGRLCDAINATAIPHGDWPLYLAERRYMFSEGHSSNAS